MGSLLKILTLAGQRQIHDMPACLSEVAARAGQSLSDLSRGRKRDDLPCAKCSTLETKEGRPMSVQDIAKLGRLLVQFLARFAHCFAPPAGRRLLAVYVRGLLSDVQRKNA